MKTSRKQFVKALENSVERVDKRIEAYHWDQNAENMHDARTGIRRMQASFDLLPKRVRKTRVVRGYLRACRDFFRKSTRSRDIDIILKLMGDHEVPDDDSTSATAVRLMKERVAILKEARKAAESIQEIPTPFFKKGDLSLSKIRRRFNRRTEGLTRGINARKQEVFEGYSSSSEELHALRKDCKKLRYMLEFFFQSPGKESKLIQELGEWQDALGHIHDLDVTIEFLKGLPATKRETSWREPIIVALLGERQNALAQLVASARERSGERLAEPIRVP